MRQRYEVVTADKVAVLRRNIPVVTEVFDSLLTSSLHEITRAMRARRVIREVMNNGRLANLPAQGFGKACGQ